MLEPDCRVAVDVQRLVFFDFFPWRDPPTRILCAFDFSTTKKWN